MNNRIAALFDDDADWSEEGILQCLIGLQERGLVRAIMGDTGDITDARWEITDLGRHSLRPELN